jgi:hypothetical protein
MVRARDVWFIRLPDGREWRAKTTRAVLHHLENGNIPPSSKVRRDPSEEWMALEWTAEFSSMVTGRPRPPEARTIKDRDSREMAALAGVAARLDPMRLQTVGVRGLWDELIAALDTAFARGKMLVAIVGAACAAMLLTPSWQKWLSDSLGVTATWPAQAIGIAASLIALIVLSWVSGLIIRIAYLELSHMRPARWREAARGFAPFGLRLVVANL